MVRPVPIVVALVVTLSLVTPLALAQSSQTDQVVTGPPYQVATGDRPASFTGGDAVAAVEYVTRDDGHVTRDDGHVTRDDGRASGDATGAGDAGTTRETTAGESTAVTTLRWNTAVTGRLAAGEVDTYRYTSDGRLTRLVVSRPAGGNGAFVVEARDQSGSPLVLFDDRFERVVTPRLAAGERVTLRTVGNATFTLDVTAAPDSGGAYTVAYDVPLIPTGDPTEPNDPRSSAWLVSVGDDVAGKIEFADTNDWYVYTSDGRPKRFALSRPEAGNDRIWLSFPGRSQFAPPVVAPTAVYPGGTWVQGVVPLTGPWHIQVYGDLTGREGPYVLSWLEESDLVALEARFVGTDGGTTGLATVPTDGLTDTRTGTRVGAYGIVT